MIIFGSDQEVAEVMRAVRRSNATGAFSWIGSDGWSARSLVSDGSEPEVEGTLSVQPQANPVKGFEAYFLNLTVDNNERNPWFVGELFELFADYDAPFGVRCVSVCVFKFQRFSLLHGVCLKLLDDFETKSLNISLC